MKFSDFERIFSMGLTRRVVLGGLLATPALHLARAAEAAVVCAVGEEMCAVWEVRLLVVETEAVAAAVVGV